MKRGLYFIVMLLTSALTATHAQDKVYKADERAFTFTGYMRAGTGVNLRGGKQVCSKLPGADTKFRLGNECDYIIEPHFDAKVASFEGNEWHVHVLPSVFRAWGETEFVRQQSEINSNVTNSQVKSDTLVTRFEQAYVYGKKIVALGHGTVWAGRRGIAQDGGLRLKITDHLLEDYGGDGVGIDNIKTPVGLLSVAALLSGRGTGLNDIVNDSRYRLPIRLTKIKNLRKGDLSVYLTLSGQLKSRDRVPDRGPENDPIVSPTKDQTPKKSPSGTALGIYQALNGPVFGGKTLLGFRYDKNDIFEIIDSTVEGLAGVPTRNVRFLFQQSGVFGGGKTAYNLVGQYRRNSRQKEFGDISLGRVSNKWVSIGARTDTQISGPFRMLVEVGHDRVKPDDGGLTRTMTKFTLAGAISAGKESWSRPTIRVFVTHTIWNEAARKVLGDGWVHEQRLQKIYGDAKSATSVGVQAETWW